LSKCDPRRAKQRFTRSAGLLIIQWSERPGRPVERLVQAREGAIGTPRCKVIIHGGLGGKVARQVIPSTVGRQYIKDSVQDLPHVGRPRPTTAPGRRQKRGHQLPLRIRKIARIAEPAPISVLPILVGPYVHLLDVTFRRAGQSPSDHRRRPPPSGRLPRFTTLRLYDTVPSDSDQQGNDPKDAEYYQPKQGPRS
jgi:hypothetical protein